MLTCEKVMERKFEAVYPECTAMEVLHLFHSNSLNSLPVVESEDSDKLVGIISAEQILFKTYYRKQSPKAVPIKEIMSSDVAICGTETTIDDALVSMLKNKAECLPVVDRQNNLVGMFTIEALKGSPELHFSWKALFSNLDEKLFESNFERTRDAYEKRMEIEVANLLSMIDIVQLKTRVAASENKDSSLKNSVSDELDILKQDLEKMLKSMFEASEDNWYLLRDEFEATRHQINKKLFYMKDTLELYSVNHAPRLTASGPIGPVRSTK